MIVVFVVYSIFRGNVNQQLSTAALSGYRVRATFSGTNEFLDNSGGGISISESRLSVAGRLTLSGNVAEDGGGLAMYGSCLVSI